MVQKISNIQSEERISYREYFEEGSEYSCREEIKNLEIVPTISQGLPLGVQSVKRLLTVFALCRLARRVAALAADVGAEAFADDDAENNLLLRRRTLGVAFAGHRVTSFLRGE